METRVIQQAKVYYLVMNPVTDRAESNRIAMVSTDKNKLLLRYTQEVVDSYNDGHYHKVFRKGGPLEWYNPLWDMARLDSFGNGIREDWAEIGNLDYIRSNYYFID